MQKARWTFRMCLIKVVLTEGLCGSCWYKKGFAYTLPMKCAIYFTMFSPADLFLPALYIKIEKKKKKRVYGSKWLHWKVLGSPNTFSSFPQHIWEFVTNFLKVECKLHSWFKNKYWGNILSLTGLSWSCHDSWLFIMSVQCNLGNKHHTSCSNCCGSIYFHQDKI